MNNERDETEMNLILQNNNNLIIKADIAGAGKTYALYNYCKVNNKRALFVCPWNSLCANLRNDKGLDAITLDKLTGMIFDGDNNFMQGKAFDVSEYDTIVFDEIFLYSTHKLQVIKNFMKANSRIRFYATGDENQNKPIEDLCVSNPKKYYCDIISSMFENNITLHENKRCKTDEDRKKIKDITQSIRQCNTKAEAINILKKNFKIINDAKQIKTKKNVCALNRTAEWINSLIHEPVEGEVYYKDLYLICRKSYSHKGLKFSVNNTYKIVHIEDDTYTLSDDEIEMFHVDKKMLDTYFRLSYARTCHSYQGMSEDEPICIFDIDHFMVDIDWIYTAITRSTCIDNIYIYLGNTPKEDKQLLKYQIRTMIDGHRLADLNKNRLLSGHKYVDVDWTLQQLKKNTRCVECHKFMDVSEPECFSIDRIDNNIGHYEFNCRVICRRCNITKK